MINGIKLFFNSGLELEYTSPEYSQKDLDALFTGLDQRKEMIVLDVTIDAVSARHVIRTSEVYYYQVVNGVGAEFDGEQLVKQIITEKSEAEYSGGKVTQIMLLQEAYDKLMRHEGAQDGTNQWLGCKLRIVEGIRTPELNNKLQQSGFLLRMEGE